MYLLSKNEVNMLTYNIFEVSFMAAVAQYSNFGEFKQENTRSYLLKN